MLYGNLLLKNILKGDPTHVFKFNHLYNKTRFLSSKSPEQQLDLIKQLRAITKEGVKSCKEALSKSDWDLKAALIGIRGDQDNNVFSFNQTNLKFGRIVVWRRLDKIVFAELKSECDFVVSSPSFSNLCKTICMSIVDAFTPEDSHLIDGSKAIHRLDFAKVKKLPVYKSADNLDIGELINRTSSEFKTAIVLDNIFTCQSNSTNILGLYVHQPVKVDNFLIGKRIGLIHLGCDIDGKYTEIVRKLANILSLQLVANPLIRHESSVDLVREFMSQQILKLDDFNECLLELGKFIDIKSITSDMSVSDALDVFKDVTSGQITLNCGIYIDSAKCVTII